MINRCFWSQSYVSYDHIITKYMWSETVIYHEKDMTFWWFWTILPSRGGMWSRKCTKMNLGTQLKASFWNNFLITCLLCLAVCRGGMWSGKYTKISLSWDEGYVITNYRTSQNYLTKSVIRNSVIWWFWTILPGRGGMWSRNCSKTRLLVKSQGSFGTFSWSHASSGWQYGPKSPNVTVFSW